MTATEIIFLINAGVILASALLVVTTRNLIHAALWLIVTLFGVAVLYALLNAGLGGEVAYLSAVGRGLGICGVGAFDGDRVNSLIEPTGKTHWSLYLMGLGSRN